MPSDEHQLFLPASLNQKRLQIHSVYSGHPHIHDHARRPGVFVAHQKIRRRIKCLVLETGRAQ
jgi:hypothetical protein